MKLIRNPFGGVDEQAMQDQFEDLCGGVARAQRLMHLHQRGFFRSRAAFVAAAARDGYTEAQCDAFLSLS